MTVNTILVTGAFGQVGKRCTEILLDRGRTVIAMDLRTDQTDATQEKLSAGHARADVGAGGTEDDDGSASHILARVQSDTLDDRRGAAVANGEAIAGAAENEESTARGSVKRTVADDRIDSGRTLRRERFDDELSAAHRFADGVVGFALQKNLHTLFEKNAESLAGAAAEMEAATDDGFTQGARPCVSPLLVLMAERIRPRVPARPARPCPCRDRGRAPGGRVLHRPTP